MNNLIKFFIKYPIWSTVIKVLVMAGGLVALFSMRSSFFPERESMDINISAVYPGASPEEVETGIIQKIEDNLKGVQGIDIFQSTSQENSAELTIEVLEGYDPDEVLMDVKNAVERINSFPVGMEPPVVAKRPATEFTLSFAVSGDYDLKSLKSITRQIENDIRDQGVISQIAVTGFPEEEIVIHVNEQTMRSYQLTFNQIAAAIRAANIDITGGAIKTNDEELLIRYEGKRYYAEELQDIVITSSPNGQDVKLREIAVVENRWAELPQRSFLNGKPAAVITINKLYGENILDIAQAARDYIDEFNARNSDIQAVIINDSTQVLRDRIDMLLNNGAVGAFLVILVLSLFLNWRLSFWVSVSIPFTFLGMFMVAKYFGITINVMSLFGCIVVVGIVVDDGIVVAEQIYQNYEKGMSPVKAAMSGTSQVLVSIFFSIATTIVAFAPFFFIDTPGPRISDMSFVVMTVLIFSLIEAAFILPAHLAHSKALSPNQKIGKVRAAFDKLLSVPRDKVYSPLLRYFSKHTILPIAITTAFVLVTIGLFSGGYIKTTFFPVIDLSSFTIVLELPSGTRENRTKEILDKIELAAWEVNEELKEKNGNGVYPITSIVKNVAINAERRGPMQASGGNTGTIQVMLESSDNGRLQKSQEISAMIREKVGPIYDAEKLEFGTASFFGKPVSIPLTGRNEKELKAAKDEIRAGFFALQELKDVTDNDPQGLREVKIQLKDKAHQLGFTAQNIMSQIRQGFFGDEVQRLQRGEDEVKVWVRYEQSNRASLYDLEDMRIRSTDGGEYPLSELVEYEIRRGSIKINHIDGAREITVEADLAKPDQSVPEVLALAMNEVVNPVLAKYPSVKTRDGGQLRRLNKLKAGQVYIQIALVLMFFLIALSFRSFSQALLVFVLLPLAVFGAFWGHLAMGMMVSIMSFYGIIALIGIVVNDSIVFINQFNDYLREGMEFDEAVYQAGMSRFRPIVLTTLTTVVGLMPLVTETSLQAQFLIPMAVSVSSGLIFGTGFILLFVPILLHLWNKAKRLVNYVWTGEKIDSRLVEPAIKEQNWIAEYND